MENILKNLNTEFLGRNLIILDEIDSTQKYIKNISKDAQNGLVVIARNQISGIGTKGRTWYTSKDKNLTFSFLLKPKCNVKNIENLTIMIAEAVIKVIKEMYGYELSIKYPNDIMLNGRKLGGILTEASILKTEVEQIVVGIGLNVNEDKFCKEIENIATSLKKECGKTFEKYEILENLLNEFEKIYMKIL